MTPAQRVAIVLGRAPFRPANMPGLMLWTDPTLASAATLATLPGYGVSPVLAQATSGQRPTVASSRITFAGASSQCLTTAAVTPNLSATTLPNGAGGSQSGKGFTCTGICRVPSDGTWWVGNYGKPTSAGAGAATFAGSLAHLSADFSTILGEITLASLGITQNTTQTGPQGVAWDSSNNSLWMACPEISNVYNVSTAGALLKTLAYTSPNGIAYDPVADQIVVSSNLLPIQWLNKSSGVVQRSLSPALPYYAEPPVLNTDNGPIDGLSIDANGFLWASSGLDGFDGFLTKVNPVSGAILQITRPGGTIAMEGNYIDTTTGVATLANDGFFHESTLNQGMTASADPGGGIWSGWAGGPQILVAGICKTNTVPGTTTALFSLGSPLLTGYYSGVGAFFGSTGDFRVISGNNVHSSTVTTTTEFLFSAIIDLTAQTISTWINGVATTPLSMSTTVAMRNMPTQVPMFGADIESGVAARFMTGTCGGLVIGSALSVPYRTKVEGALCWKLGVQTLLPATHAYRYSPP